MNNEEKPLSPEDAVLRDILNTRATVGQIAQLAATLSHAHPKNTAIQLTEKALKLWETSKTLLYTTTRDDFHDAEMSALQDDNMEFVPRCKRYPVPFDEALRVIVGAKTRLPNRHKQFRDFLKEDSEEKHFAELKEKGFSHGDFENNYLSFMVWSQKRTRKINYERAKKAAAAKWKMKK